MNFFPFLNGFNEFRELITFLRHFIIINHYFWRAKLEVQEVFAGQQLSNVHLYLTKNNFFLLLF